jgi:anti-sigma regulatory factor (Ser/Thr protein kinase)
VGLPREKVQGAHLPDPSAERGRGFPIMQRCTDFFEIRTFPTGGVAVVLGRYLRGNGKMKAASQGLAQRIRTDAGTY